MGECMSANTFGHLFQTTTFGESHGPLMGAVIQGCPSGVPISLSEIQTWLDRRRPGQSELVSARNEPDQVEVVSGLYKGLTLGTPIALLIRNQDARPQDYQKEALAKRTGHATDLWQKKFDHADPRGSGRASGRETVSRVAAGALAYQVIRVLYPDFDVLALASAIGPIVAPSTLTTKWLDQFVQTSLHRDDIHPFASRIPDTELNQQTINLLVQAKDRGESYGGSVLCLIRGLPAGLGQPVFAKLKSDLTSALMSIGTSLSVSIGPHEPEPLTHSGSTFHQDESHYGGIRGGLSTGEPIYLKVTFKPVASRGLAAQEGRHDPCIIPRVLPIVEAMVSLVIVDHLLWSRLDRIDFTTKPIV